LGREQEDLGVGGGRDELGRRLGVEGRLVAMASSARGETARRARQQRAEGEGVRVANEKASSREFGSGRRGARRAHGRRRGQLGHGDHAQG